MFLLSTVLWIVFFLLFLMFAHLYFGSTFECELKNLAPELVRQRCIIELNTDHVITQDEIKDYLQKLSEVVEMTVLQPPFSYPAFVKEVYVGDGGWIHWATSGAHAYSYIPQWTKTGKPLFTVDAYTCKPFSLEKAAQFTKEYFGATEIVWKEVKI